MRHGGFARVTDRSIFLAPDLLRPLFVSEGSTAYMVYHPPISAEETRHLATHGDAPRTPPGAGRLDDREASQFPFDLILTPIPPRLWPTVARLTIYIAHRNGALQEVADFLARNNVNILLAECTRSTRSHAVWSMVVDFVDLHEPDAARLNVQVPELWTTGMYAASEEKPAGTLQRCLALYRRTRRRLDELVGKPPHEGNGGKGTGKLREWARAIEDARGPGTSPVFFHIAGGGEDPWFDRPHKALWDNVAFPRNAIHGDPLSDLKFLHTRVVARYLCVHPGGEFLPFRVDCLDAERLAVGKTGQAVLQSPGLRSAVPTYAAAEMAADECYLRLSLIPPDALESFRRVELTYQCRGAGRPTRADSGSTRPAAGASTSNGNWAGSQGLLAAATRHLAQRYSLWRVVNHTRQLREPERGHLTFILRAVEGKAKDAEIRELILRGIDPDALWIDLTRPIDITRIAPFRVFVSSKHQWPRRGDFLRFVRRQAALLGVRKEDVVVVDEPGGVPFQNVREELNACDGVLLLSFAEPDAGPAHLNWLEAEGFAAYCQHKGVVIIGPPEDAHHAGRVFRGWQAMPLSPVCSDRDAVRTIRRALLYLLRYSRRHADRPANGRS